MLITAFVILGIAVSMGALLAVLYLRAGTALTASGSLAAFHGLVAVAGLVCLIFALRGPPRVAHMGTSSFGMIAIWLLALAALIGGGMLAWSLRGKRRSEMVIGIHATLAVSGFVVLAAYIFAA